MEDKGDEGPWRTMGLRFQVGGYRCCWAVPAGVEITSLRCLRDSNGHLLEAAGYGKLEFTGVVEICKMDKITLALFSLSTPVIKEFMQRKVLQSQQDSEVISQKTFKEVSYYVALAGLELTM